MRLVAWTLQMACALALANSREGLVKPEFGRLNWVRSSDPSAASRPVIVGIPGGPGLSSATLKGIEALSVNFDLALVDPPGTGGTAELPQLSLESMITALANLIGTIHRPIGLVGHSFGGVYAAELARTGRLNVVGIVFVASPLNTNITHVLGQTYSAHKSSKLRALEHELEKDWNQKSFSKWMRSCSLEFFAKANESLADQIGSDLSSSRTYKILRPVLPPPELHNWIQEAPLTKLVVSAERDALIDASLLQTLASDLSAKFELIPDGEHFLFWTNQVTTVDVISDFFLTDGGSEQ